MKKHWKSLWRSVCALILAITLLGSSLAATAEYSKADLNTSVASDATQVDLSALSGDYTISTAGDYVLTGTLNGQVLIDAGENDKVHLILNNATIRNLRGVAIYGLEADKIIVTLMEGTQNVISDGSNYAMDEEGANAAIYTKTDLTLNGSGSLQITGNTAHAIRSNDDLVMVDGTYQVQAVQDGLHGSDSVQIKAGTYIITAGSDGIVATKDEADKGSVLIEGGSFTIIATNDGIQAQNTLEIADGVFDILTGTGGANGNQFQQGPDHRQPGGWGEVITTGETVSTKGLKAVNELIINGGKFLISAQDDAIHSNGKVTVNDGEFSISTGDDGIHADQDVLVNGGTITITQSYEGIEGKTVTIAGGIINITASDDGINAADGTVSQGFGGWGGRGDMSAQAGVSVTISGGSITVTSGFDSIDSNGTLVISGGEVNLTTLRGDGGTAAIDTNGGFTHLGGTVVTNDGSETGRPGRRRP